MKSIFINSALFRICSAPIFGVLVYLIILLINNTVEGINKIFSNEELYVCIALSFVLLESMRLAIRLIDRVESKFSFERRIIIQLIITMLTGLTLVAVVISLYFRWAFGFSITSHQLNTFLGIFSVAGLLYNLLYFSHVYLLRENRMRIEQEKKMQEKVEADFLSFKNEINPDLLYESLENLILTLHHNADQAEEQIDYLAGIYRYSLVNRDKELIAIDEELRATENLMSLLNYKYQKQLNLVVDIPKQHEIHLIPGSLLITIDSIVRNTLISSKSPLVVRLYLEEDDDYIVLQHSLNDRLQQHSESLNAFSRLQRSYSFFSEKPFVQVKAGKENYIKFPLVRINDQTLSIPA
ncbi:MAG TPA: histidine kinase [Cyclobacteriaceae bacterium]